MKKHIGSTGSVLLSVFFAVACGSRSSSQALQSPQSPQNQETNAQAQSNLSSRSGTGIRSVEALKAGQLTLTKDVELGLASGTVKAAQTTEDYVQAAIRLIGSYETGGAGYSALSGDFDGQGISFGVFQWNIGQGSLQPILKDVINEAADDVKRIFGQDYANFVKLSKAPAGTAGVDLVYSLGVLSGTQVESQWRAEFQQLGKLAKMQEIQVRYSKPVTDRAMSEMTSLGFVQVRSLMVLIQNAVQCGYTYKETGDAEVSGRYRTWLASHKSVSEKEKLTQLVTYLVDAVKGEWAEDVRTRIFTIINGQGTVHGITYNIEQDFGVKLDANIRGGSGPVTSVFDVISFIKSADGTANIRSGAGVDSSVLAVVKNGDIILTEQKSGEWIKTGFYTDKSKRKLFSSEAWISNSLLNCKTADASWCVVNSDDGSANVRAGAGSTTSVVTVLKNGDMVQAGSSSSGWVKLASYVTKADFKALASSGWVHESVISDVPPSDKPLPQCWQNADDGIVNLRSSPSLDGSVLGTLTGTAKLTKLGETTGSGCSGAWYKLDNNGKPVYACSTQLQCTGDSTGKRLNVPYFCQNEIADVSQRQRVCNLTSLAMVANYYGINTNPDKLLNMYGAPATSLDAIGDAAGMINMSVAAKTVRATMADIKKYIDAGKPVILGNVFVRSAGGHFVVVTGYDSTGFFINDPNGRWTGGRHSGYDLICEGGNRAGNNLHYTYAQVLLGSTEAGEGDGDLWIIVPSK